MTKLRKLVHFKEMNIQLASYWIIHTTKKTKE